MRQPRRLDTRSHRTRGALLFNVLAMVAEFESDLIKMRTRERLMKQGERGA